MTKFQIWVIDIFACHTLLVNRKLDAGDRENTVKISAMITIAFPLIVALVTIVALASTQLSTDQIRAYVVVAALAIVFGVSSVTDRIYDRNTADIRHRAAEIEQNLDQGVMWVRRRLFKIYLGNMAAMAAIIALIKVVA